MPKALEGLIFTLTRHLKLTVEAVEATEVKRRWYGGLITNRRDLKRLDGALNEVAKGELRAPLTTTAPSALKDTTARVDHERDPAL